MSYDYLFMDEIEPLLPEMEERGVSEVARGPQGFLKQWRNAKNDPDLYQRIAERTQTAYDNAKWVKEVHFRDRRHPMECDSSTEVYRLVGPLLGLDAMSGAEVGS